MMTECLFGFQLMPRYIWELSRVLIFSLILFLEESRVEGFVMYEWSLTQSSILHCMYESRVFVCCFFEGESKK